VRREVSLDAALDESSQRIEGLLARQTSLMVAVRNAQFDLIKLLLAAGAKVNLTSKTGETAVSIAQSLKPGGRVQCVPISQQTTLFGCFRKLQSRTVSDLRDVFAINPRNSHHINCSLHSKSRRYRSSKLPRVSERVMMWQWRIRDHADAVQWRCASKLEIRRDVKHQVPFATCRLQVGVADTAELNAEINAWKRSGNQFREFW
jgi:hypothetical protein